MTKEFNYKDYLKNNPLINDEKYLVNNLLKEEYTPGRKWSPDFDYNGMINYGLNISPNDSLETLVKLADDFEDVNYHTEVSHLFKAIDALVIGNEDDATTYIADFKSSLNKLINDYESEEGFMNSIGIQYEDKTLKNTIKKADLKAKIKEMIVSEYNNKVEIKEEEEEEEIDTTDVAVDDTETIDTETEVEVDPNVKSVQDALTQAQVAAQKLGDKKLTDQIGNTITFFTRTHVVDKGAVAEADEMEEGKKESYSGKSDSNFYKDIASQYDHYKKGDYDKLKNKEYYNDAESDDAAHINALEKDMKDDKDSSMKIKEVVFPMWQRIK